MTAISFTVAGVPAPQGERVCPLCLGAGRLVDLDKRTRTDLARFFAKVAIDDATGCWNWIGARTAKGYGTFGWGPTRHRGGMPAHRASYEMFVGPIAAGLHIDHLCRNRACVNPEHLEPVTPRVNVLRGEGLGARQARRTHCDHGHEFTAENTIVRENGARRCRECTNARHRRDYRRART